MKKSIFSQEYPCFKKVFLLLCLIYSLSALAIIRADFRYIDDLGRTLGHYQDWAYFGRYTSEIGSTLLHTDRFMTDISPLTQLITTAVLALSSTIMIYAFSDGRKISAWQIAAVLPLGLSPYFLECISYKFDAPYMAVSVFGMVFPLLFAKSSYKLYLPAIFAGTILTCTSYQAGLGILPMMVISMTLTKWNRKECTKDVLRFALLSAAAYCAGMIFFRFVLLDPFDSYVSSSLLPASQILTGSLRNLKEYYRLIASDFRFLWEALVGVIIASYILVQTLQSKRNKLLSLLVAAVSVAMMGALAFGVYIVLETPIFHPRAMYGFGAMIAILAVQTCSAEILNRRYLMKMACFLLSWCFFVFSFTYGNALSEEKRYTDFRIGMAISDLNDCEFMLTDTPKIAKLSGDTVRSRVITSIARQYPVIDRLVPVTLSGDWNWAWGQAYFFHYFGLKKIDWNMYKDMDMKSMDLPVVKDTMYHTIKSDGTYLLIELKD